MDWDTLVSEITDSHPEIRLSSMFGMPCLKRGTGKVLAGSWKDGGITVKITDATQREAVLTLPGVTLFDPGMGRVMKEWVHVPTAQSERWVEIVEQSI